VSIRLREAAGIIQEFRSRLDTVGVPYVFELHDRTLEDSQKALAASALPDTGGDNTEKDDRYELDTLPPNPGAVLYMKHLDACAKAMGSGRWYDILGVAYDPSETHEPVTEAKPCTEDELSKTIRQVIQPSLGECFESFNVDDRKEELAVKAKRNSLTPAWAFYIPLLMVAGRRLGLKRRQCIAAIDREFGETLSDIDSSTTPGERKSVRWHNTVGIAVAQLKALRMLDPHAEIGVCHVTDLGRRFLKSLKGVRDESIVTERLKALHAEALNTRRLQGATPCI
jgi:hypothetical protein